MLRHGAIRIALVLLPLAVSTSRLHAHTVSTPAAATQEINRCLTIVRVAASRRTAPAQRARTPKPSPRSRVVATTDYRIPAGTPLTIRLRTPLDSASGQVGEAVRATLTSTFAQEGAELIPAGSVLHGKITDAVAASKENPLGRIALQFHVIEHLETHSLATIATRALEFEAPPLRPGVKRSDVQVAAGENVVITLARPLVVHIPRK
jgi:hypothetical protein